MTQETAHSFAISDLLSVLNEILDSESSGLREISLPLTSSASSLQSEINRLEARVRDISRLIPSLRKVAQPVNRLPPETLSHIAQYLIDDHDEDAISIVPLTHVCRYWRRSIISTPANWTLISSENEDMTAVSLQRAKAAPLKITLHMPLGSSSHDIFAPYLQNTRALAIHSISTIEELTKTFPSFPKSMLNLRSLELGHLFDDDESEFQTGSNRSTDPFGSFIPPLEYLLLRDIPLYPSLRGLKTLTEVYIEYCELNFHLNTLLDFLEANHSLERVTLDIQFVESSLLSSPHKTIRTQLRYLSIQTNKISSQALLSSIPLQRGAELHVSILEPYQRTTLDDFFPDISMAHLSNPPSPTFFKLEYGPYSNRIILDGPGGKLSLNGISLSEVSFTDLTLRLLLANVREVHLQYRKGDPDTWEPPVFYPSYFPALETLTVDCDADLRNILSVLLSNSPPSPSLKTIVFLDCDLSKNLVKRLVKFASERRNNPTLAPLHRVQIVHGDRTFPPSEAWIRRLREHISVVEVRMEEGPSGRASSPFSRYSALVWHAVVNGLAI
ncbi:hypothetical protein BJ322DRAFT_1222039 [Thelephora terrestris]|uniref:F-box domain-containing protein n=1 Tax=Thelephora terrestris TaxID=56493 RepID=A0A9P6H2Q9_9AGAM|nr:hypothetical protein BJ322DRAFT_1222039 [Thelephora terrestris]